MYFRPLTNVVIQPSPDPPSGGQIKASVAVVNRRRASLLLLVNPFPAELLRTSQQMLSAVAHESSFSFYHTKIKLTRIRMFLPKLSQSPQTS